MKSITYGEVSIEKIRTILEDKLIKNEGLSLSITVGTDSQSFCEYTKMVGVVAICFERKGGIFFYDCEYVRPITNLHEKLIHETNKSIEIATALFEELQKSEIPELTDCHITIHSDIGKNGPTKQLISEIVGWITACGFECEIKPNSFAASTIANKISK